MIPQLKALVLFVALLTLSSSALAKTVKCAVDDLYSGESVDVPLAADFNQDQSVSFKGTTVSAIYSAGNQFESQSVLIMNIGNVSSSMYDIRLDKQVGPMNVLTQGDVRFQCYAE